ncbi:MAG: PH domain-containing protein [Mangrovibacterium sp.]|nr:PH domain-containing protein [Mangrovibacterium sp.]
MIENTTYIKCRPSQLLNLGNFLRVLVLVPALFLPDELVRHVLPVSYLPEKLAVHLFRLPVYLAVIAALNLGYHILRIRCIRYEITPEELKHYSGILNRKHEFIELYRVKDFRIERPFIYRVFGLGTLVIYTSDKTTPVFRMEAVRNTEDTYTVLRGFVERNRREKHVFEVD